MNNILKGSALTVLPVTQNLLLIGASVFGSDKFALSDYLISCIVPFYAWYALITG